MKKSEEKYIAGENLKDVTILPHFILRAWGKWDARRGEDIALAHISRYLETCMSIENGECLASEEFLKNVRSEGARNLDIIENAVRKLNDIPVIVTAENSFDILENRRRARTKAVAEDDITKARSRLYEINEEIINGTSILDQRIEKIRKRAASKISAYVKGVRAGGLTSFDPEIVFSDSEVDKYYKKHKRDKAITAFAAVSFGEEDY